MELELLTKGVDELKGAVLGRLEKIETKLSEVDAIAIETAKKVGRPVFGMSGDSSAQSAEEQKAVGNAVRALLAGDQAKANQFFIEAKGMSAGSDPEGGYTVVPQFSRE